MPVTSNTGSVSAAFTTLLSPALLKGESPSIKIERPFSLATNTRWHEATSIAEFSFNKKAYESLPTEYRRALDYAAAVILAGSDAEYFVKNSIGLHRLNTEFKTKVELIRFTDAFLDGARKVSAQVMQEESDKSPLAKKVAAAHAKFLASTAEWAKVEGSYYSTLSQ